MGAAAPFRVRPEMSRCDGLVDEARGRLLTIRSPGLPLPGYAAAHRFKGE